MYPTTMLSVSVYACVCLSFDLSPFQLLDQLTDFFETWYKCYTIGGN